MLRARHVVAAGLLALAGSALPARAQPLGYVFQAPDAPTVLQTDRFGRVIVPPTRPDLAVPPVPVPHVMNGGGFGLTGFDYYNDASSEGRFGVRKQPKTYVLAPAPIDPAWRY
ncbi:hypothetical protein DK427_14310 [Methylobacterium radiodurans]|uniref:Uncharacterized protein n=1 Tax=Methylobacterium radiodurans TaxID=2202828 RepID=A0A2U8W056_9HYPH|nr:hypothetical protein DK427_14310 [Methylobacterium radiodurans]